jgi:hypothetical protein
MPHFCNKRAMAVPGGKSRNARFRRSMAGTRSGQRIDCRTVEMTFDRFYILYRFRADFQKDIDTTEKKRRYSCLTAVCMMMLAKQ